MTELPEQRRQSGSPTNLDEKNIGLEDTPSGVYLTAEEAELAKLGYKEEFKREFSWISTFSFAFSISGLLATVRVSLRCFLFPGNHNFRISVSGWRAAGCRMVLVIIP